MVRELNLLSLNNILRDNAIVYHNYNEVTKYFKATIDYKSNKIMDSDAFL